MTTGITEALHAAYRQARSAVLYGVIGTPIGDGDGVSEGDALAIAAEFFHLVNPLFERYAPVRTSPDAVRAWLRQQGWDRAGEGRCWDFWQMPGTYPVAEVMVPSAPASDFGKRWPEMWDGLVEQTGQSVDELISAVALFAEGSG